LAKKNPEEEERTRMKKEQEEKEKELLRQELDQNFKMFKK
jgi:hypothetical protein